MICDVGLSGYGSVWAVPWITLPTCDVELKMKLNKLTITWWSVGLSGYGSVWAVPWITLPTCDVELKMKLNKLTITWWSVGLSGCGSVWAVPWITLPTCDVELKMKLNKIEYTYNYLHDLWCRSFWVWFCMGCSMDCSTSLWCWVGSGQIPTTAMMIMMRRKEAGLLYLPTTPYPWRTAMTTGWCSNQNHTLMVAWTR